MNRNNGRVIFPKNNPKMPFEIYDKIPVNQCSTYQDAVLGVWEDSTLSKLFFSKENIQILQNGIRAGVYSQSNKQYIIAQQDCDCLKIIIRSVYLQHALNNPKNITQQIQNLNDIVITYCVNTILGEADGYLKYLHDVSTLVVPMDLPVQAYVNDKQLFLKDFF